MSDRHTFANEGNSRSLSAINQHAVGSQRVINQHGQPIGSPLPDWMPCAPPSRQVLSGNFCCLEPMTLDHHLADLFAANLLAADDRSWTYLGYGPFATLDEYRTWAAETCLGDDPQFYAVVDLSAEKAVGLASYLRIAPAIGSIELGHIHYSPLLQRTTAATEAIYLMLDHAFALGYRRCEWKCDALNAASRSAAERFGFTFEGIHRQAMVYKHRNRDTAWYSLLDHEWPERREPLQAWLSPDNFDDQQQQRRRLAELRPRRA